MKKYFSEEERKAAIKEDKRRWRLNNIEKDRQIKRETYARRQAKLGKVVFSRVDTPNEAPVYLPSQAPAKLNQAAVNDSEGGMATWSSFSLKVKVEVRCYPMKLLM
jgi:hypothetical protein